MAATLGGVAILYASWILFLRFPVLSWLGYERLLRHQSTAKWLFFRKPLKVRLVERWPERFMPGAPAPDMGPWQVPAGTRCNCFAHMHDVVEDGRTVNGLAGTLQEDHLLLQRLYALLQHGSRWAAWPRMLVGLRLDGLRRVTWTSLLRRDERRHLVVVLHEPNTNNSHAHRLNRDGTWSDKPGTEGVRHPSDPSWHCGLTGYKIVGYYWVNHLDSTVRAVQGKEPHTRVRFRRALSVP